MSFINSGGGCSTWLHLLVQYPKTAACVAILGLPTGIVLTSEQLAECDAKVAACKAPPVVPITPPPVEAVATPVAPPPVVVAVPTPALVVDPCADAPSITKADLFVSSGKPFLWKNPGLDPVRGKAPQPYLAKLQFTPAEMDIFLKKIAKKEAVTTTLKKGDKLGLMNSGSGKMRNNAVVDYTPTAKNNGVRVYTTKQVVRLDGECVTRELILLEPFVCSNWSRLSDVITPKK